MCVCVCVCVYGRTADSNAFSNLEIEWRYQFPSRSSHFQLEKEFSLLVFVRFLACFTSVLIA